VTFPFDEVVFPKVASYATADAQGLRGEYFEDAAGQIAHVADEADPRQRFDLSLRTMKGPDVAAIMAFWRARGGGRRGFRYEAFSDFTSKADGRSAPGFLDQLIGIGDGVTTKFQVVKNYISGSSVETRVLTKIQPGSLVIGVNGAQQAPSAFAADLTTGLVTFVSAPGVGTAVTAGYRFHVPVIFGPGANAAIAARFNGYNNEDVENSDLIELLPSQMLRPRDIPGRGAITTENVGGHVAVERLGPQVWRSTSNGTLGWLLPEPQDLPGGWKYILVNDSGASKAINFLPLQVPGGQVRQVVLIRLADGSFNWRWF
jgi:uncharacterized protein (TIGR02217 family)